MTIKYCEKCLEPIRVEYELCPKCGSIQRGLPKESYHLMPGTLLNNRYILGQAIGFGGFGITYLCRDLKLNRKVAIKEYLPSDFATRIPKQQDVMIYEGEKAEQFESGREKFVEEARRIAACKNAPNVVKVYDNLQLNNTAYIVMEYLEGQTVREYLDKNGGRLSVDVALQIMLPVLEGLDAVHKEGIIHRDISPENIYILENMKDIRILDFGAARYATTSHSKSLSVILKPGFAPEEQYRGKGNQGPWSDIYSCGATIYKLITGVTPQEALERKFADKLVAPSKLKAKISKNAEIALLNALNVKAENRIQSASDFINQLNGTAEAKRVRERLESEATSKLPVKTKLALGASGILSAVGVLVGVFLITFTTLISDRSVDASNVPDLINKTEQEADALVSNYDAPLVIVGGDYHQEIMEDVIISQEPEAGLFMQESTVIEVFKSYGPKMALVPIATDRYIENATSELEGLGFVIETKYVDSTTVPKGVVVSQGKESGESHRIDGTIVLEVSNGTSVQQTTQTIVPLVSGMSFDSAKQLLIESDLYAVRSEEFEYSMTVPAGEVVGQKMTAGEPAQSGSVVELVVSLGVEQRLIPNVAFKQLTEAQSTLESEKMNHTVIEYQEHDSIAEGGVISQSPEAGLKVDVQTEVQLVVSLGKRSEMANVVGKTLANATSQLQNLGFAVISHEEVWSDTVPKGQVISQQPASSNERINILTPVSLVVSKGIEQVPVPNVIGLTKTQAESTITSTGKLNVSFQTEHKAGLDIDDVHKQSIAGGSTVDKGSTVILTYSPAVTVPTVNDANLDSEIANLKSQGYNVTTVEEESSNVDIGELINQNPSAGTRVSYGSTISLTVSKGIRVPDFVGDYIEDAESDASQLNLSVSSSEVFEYGVDVGEVTEQSITSGSYVNPGTNISLTYSNGVEMPDVIGMDIYQARNMLENLGFNVSTSINDSSRYSYETVVSQSSSGGEVLRYGSDISLTYTVYFSGYGEWLETHPSGVDTNLFNIEEQQLYRTMSRETQVSGESAIAGWTLVSSQLVEGPWSDWSSEVAYATSTREVEEKESIFSITSTQFRYSRWWYYNTERGMYIGSYAQYEGPNYQSGTGSWQYTNWSLIKGTPSTVYDGYQSYLIDGSYYFNEEVNEISTPSLVYRYRDITTSNTFEKWGDWTEWNSTLATENENLKVEAKTQYRYTLK